MATDPGAFSIGSATHNGRIVLTVRGELDMATAPELEQALRETLDGGGDVLLDLRELEFMDSSGVRVLVTAHAHAVASGLHFAVIRPPRDTPVDRILSVAGLEAQLTLLDELGPLD